MIKKYQEIEDAIIHGVKKGREVSYHVKKALTLADAKKLCEEKGLRVKESAISSLPPHKILDKEKHSEINQWGRINLPNPTLELNPNKTYAQLKWIILYYFAHWILHEPLIKEQEDVGRSFFYIGRYTPEDFKAKAFMTELYCPHFLWTQKPNGSIEELMKYFEAPKNAVISKLNNEFLYHKSMLKDKLKYLEEELENEKQKNNAILNAKENYMTQQLPDEKSFNCVMDDVLEKMSNDPDSEFIPF